MFLVLGYSGLRHAQNEGRAEDAEGISMKGQWILAEIW